MDVIIVVFFFKQKTAYEITPSDWSSDVCSSDLTVAPTQFTITRPRLEQIERTVSAIDPLYTQFLAAPAADSADAREAHDALLVKLRDEERKLWDMINKLSDHLENSAVRTSNYLEQNQRTLRVRAILLGIAAVVLGLLVTSWVVITLRPLRRLR